MVANEASSHGRFLIEGVRALSTLHHGIEADAVVFLTQPKIPLTETQQRFAQQRITNYRRYDLNGMVVYEW